MATPEIRLEAASQGRKRESAEDECSDDDVYEESDNSTESDSDDPSYDILEGKPNVKIWKQYLKEWRESEGFDISVHPGTSMMAGLVQLHDYLTNPEEKQKYTDLCKLAIQHFNSNNDTMYAFQEIVKVNAAFSMVRICYYFTFTARDTTVVATTDAIKTFQALVDHGSNETIDVSFCRLKKFLTNQNKKKKKKKKKNQQNGKAVTEVEQDKPSLLKSILPGLVVEELSKGKPTRKKTYIGFKVAVRYTAKLKESGKIFETNIGDEKPFEFRIGDGKTIKGLTFGVLGMHVGDKRRITIPPISGYGDEGYGDVVPPDAWLVYEVELEDIIY